MSLIDTSTAFGQRAERRLRDERIAWLVTVRKNGSPLPVPVWFLWEDDSVLLYSQPETQKLRNIAANPHVAVHLDGNGQGGDIVVVHGDAEVDESAPKAHELPEYVSKYADFIARNGWTPEGFAADYSVPVRVRVTRVTGF